MRYISVPSWTKYELSNSFQKQNSRVQKVWQPKKIFLNSIWVSCAVVRQFTNPVKHQIHYFFANGVVTSSQLMTASKTQYCISNENVEKQNAQSDTSGKKTMQGSSRIMPCMSRDAQKSGHVTSCKVVGRVLFSRNQLFWMEELAVCARAHLVNHCRFLSASGPLFCC